MFSLGLRGTRRFSRFHVPRFAHNMHHGDCYKLEVGLVASLRTAASATQRQIAQSWREKRTGKPINPSEFRARAF